MKKFIQETNETVGTNIEGLGLRAIFSYDSAICVNTCSREIPHDSQSLVSLFSKMRFHHRPIPFFLSSFLLDASALKVSEKTLAKSRLISEMSQIVNKQQNAPSIEKNNKESLNRSILSKAKPVSRSLRQGNNFLLPKRSEEISYHKEYDKRMTEYYEEQEDFLDLSQYSIKFHSCASLASSEFDGGEGDDDGTNENEEIYPYNTAQVVNFRLCPTDTCQSDTWDGCSDVYGNYIVSLEDYFEAQGEYKELVFGQFCGYCTHCSYIYENFNAKCEYYDACSNYGDVCYDEAGENDDNSHDDDGEVEEELSFEHFLECTEVDVLEDALYYTMCSYCKQCDYFWTNFKAKCSNFEMCSDYKEICVNDNDGNNDGDNRRLEENEGDHDGNKDYYEVGNIEHVYLKMFCDGSLQVGMFSDDKCTNYISDKVDMFNTTGLSFTADDIESTYTSSRCFPCARKVSCKGFKGLFYPLVFILP